MELEAETAIKCKTHKIKLVYILTQWVTHLNQSASEVLLFVACETA